MFFIDLGDNEPFNCSKVVCVPRSEKWLFMRRIGCQNRKLEEKQKKQVTFVSVRVHSMQSRFSS